ncbi:HNH endonuclease signature motif containing protein [Blastococcus tunisiensis]|uniref:HNH endonuclease signature motif containing protein n=1 Tax=Blastococcus tunisiensis TaxID=1798228 RepID=UPI001587C756|nr:HNH endonuclease signature motif containing protein [Blastococcus sp. DSM 46838]
MFDGGGFGVGMTVIPVGALPWGGDLPPADVLPAGVVARPSRLGEMLPVTSREDSSIAVELQRITRLEAQLAAYRAELVTELAVRRPDAADRQPGEPGAASPGWAPGPGGEQVPGVSEFFADELAMIGNCSRTAATTLAEHCLLLTRVLTATWAALADGRLDWPRARALAAELAAAAREVEPGLLAQVEAAVLPRAHRLSIRGLQAAARTELLRLDPAAADRRRKRATRDADVTVRPLPDGMAELSVFLPHPMATTIHQTLDRYARMAKADGDEHRIGQLRVGVLYDLITRPWDTSRAPVTATLTVLAPLGTLRTGAAGHDACAFGHLPADHRTGTGETPADGCAGGCGRAEPAEADGQPITAAHLRDLLEQLDALCPGGLQAPAGGALHLALTDPVSGRLRATVTHAELERLARRGCPEHPDGATRNGTETCDCPVLDRPSPVDRYRHTPAQERFVTTRDRTCRHPGCHNRAAWADLDHVLAHADGGATACENLCCLCRRHHRLKTHATGWTFTMTDDGTLTVTTPSGVTRTTRPPGLAGPDDPVDHDEPAPF